MSVPLPPSLFHPLLTVSESIKRRILMIGSHTLESFSLTFTARPNALLTQCLFNHWRRSRAEVGPIECNSRQELQLEPLSLFQMSLVESSRPLLFLRGEFERVWPNNDPATSYSFILAKQLISNGNFYFLASHAACLKWMDKHEASYSSRPLLLIPITT